MMEDLFTLAFKNLKRRRLRSWLTMVGIFISIAIIFILVSLSLGLDAAIQEQFRTLGTDKFFITPRGQLAGPGTTSAAQLTIADVEVIERVSGVRDVSYFTATSTKVERGGETRYATAVGAPTDKLDVLIETGFYTPEEGRLLRDGDNNRVMIGSQYKYNNFFSRPVEVGDTLTINNMDFRVVGILETVGSPPDDKLIYMPLENFRDVYNSTGERIDQIAVQIEEGSDINDVAEKVKKRLYSHRDVDEKTQDFTILTPEELLATIGIVLNIITGFLLGVAAISLLVGGIGVANTMYTSVIERLKEIGVMKAIGAKNSSILTLFTIEAGLLGLVGGVIGIIIGMGIAKLVELAVLISLGSPLLKAAFPIYLMAGCLIFSFLVGALSGLLPAWQASRIKPVDTLRYE